MKVFREPSHTHDVVPDIIGFSLLPVLHNYNY